MLGLYNALLSIPRAAALAWAPLASRRSAEAARAWGERLARTLPSAPSGGVWIHGASVGEARLVGLLAAALRERSPRLPLYVSAVSPTGRSRLPEPPAADAAFFAPLDFRGLPGRVLDALSPALLVLVETEIWPNLLREASVRGVPSAIVNGRLSPGKMVRYKRLRALYAPALREISWIGAQSEAEARRFASLRARPESIVVTGNLKYDLPPPKVDREAIRARLGLAPERRVVVAGSTGAGEEPPVLEAFLFARARHPGLYLVLAPRHPSRAQEVEDQARARGVSLVRLGAAGGGKAATGDGLLVDTIGDLPSLYAIAEAAFVGGSLVPIGGHNLLEPAALGVPVLFGPHTHHTADLARDLESRGAGARVADGPALGEAWCALLSDRPRREAAAAAAAGLVRESRGALERTVDRLLALARVA